MGKTSMIPLENTGEARTSYLLSIFYCCCTRLVLRGCLDMIVRMFPMAGLLSPLPRPLPLPSCPGPLRPVVVFSFQILFEEEASHRCLLIISLLRRAEGLGYSAWFNLQAPSILLCWEQGSVCCVMLL